MIKRLPPGSYFVGDPELALSPEDWEVMKQDSHDELTSGDIFLFKDQECWGHEIDGNAGQYTDRNEEYFFPITSNIIAVIPKDLISSYNELPGTIITVSKTFNVEFTAGVFRIHKLVIDTTYDMYSDDWEETEEGLDSWGSDFD
jgi:hypothetical protein